MRRLWFANIAISKDGYIGIKDHQINISSEEDWRVVHNLRNQSAGIGIGSNTLIIDNPKLLVKRKYINTLPVSHPVPIIFDRRGRLTKNHNVITSLSSRQILWCTRSDNIIENVTKIFYQELTQVCNKIEIILNQLERSGGIMIEGGVQLIESMLEKNIITKIRIFESNYELNQGIEFNKDKILENTKLKSRKPMNEGVEEIYIRE